MSRIRIAVLGAALAFGVLPAVSATASGHSVNCVNDVGAYAGNCNNTFTTIQAAVNGSNPGDLVLIGAGTYAGGISVGSNSDGEVLDGLVIRGVNRNTVIIDGNNATIADGFAITAPNVEVSNLTSRRHSRNGVYWYGFESAYNRGYTGNYLTTYNNGLYGVYAFLTEGPGLIANSYGSGHPDSAFYIGGCNPCNAVITDVFATRNGLGYSGTNASNGITIKDSVWVHNGGGIVPNSLDSEPDPPQCCIVIENNQIIDSSEDDTIPSTGSTSIAAGAGIIIAGGNGNVIRNNIILDSDRYGIVLTPFPSESGNVYRANGNMVENNLVENKPFAAYRLDPTDAQTVIANYELVIAAGSGDMNCFSGNEKVDGSEPSSDPPLVQTLYACQTDAVLRNSPVSGGVSAVDLAAGLGTRPGNGSKAVYLAEPVPEAQATMPNPLQGF